MISGKFILITGGSSGIGKHLAGELLRSGNKVIIASNNPSGLGEAAKDLREISPNLFHYLVDVGNTASVQEMFETLLQEHGCPDILVNCAGFAMYRTFEETPIDEIEQLVSVNLLGAMRCTHFLLPAMIARRHGSIVNIASVAGKMVITPNSIYCGSKHGIVGWSEALKYEISRFNIDISVVCPGRVETNFFDHETFQTRAPRTETQMTVPIETVSKKIMEAIEKRRFLTYIPSYYVFVVWLLNTIPFLTKPIYGRLLSSRIDTLYRTKRNNI
jgi:uncharacterized protein